MKSKLAALYKKYHPGATKATLETIRVSGSQTLYNQLEDGLRAAVDAARANIAAAHAEQAGAQAGAADADAEQAADAQVEPADAAAGTPVGQPQYIDNNAGIQVIRYECF